MPHLIRSSRLAPVTDLQGRSAIRLSRGIYWEPDPRAQGWQHRHTLCLARAKAAHLSHTGSYLSHTSAALWLGLAQYSQQPDVYLAVGSRPTHMPLPVVEFTASGEPFASAHPRFDRQLTLWRRGLDLHRDELVVANGLPMTSPLRTAFDCACDEPALNALSIADSALRLVCRPDRRHPTDATAPWAQAIRVWDELIARHPRRRGIAQARAILAAASPWAESVLESATRWLLHAIGAEPPHLQHQISLGTGPAWVDLCWPQYQLIIEVDGRVKYASRQDAWKEKHRQDAIHELGWTFLRLSSSDLARPEALAMRIRQAFPPTAVASFAPRPEFLRPGAALADGLDAASALSRPRSQPRSRSQPQRA
ncbi:endonuclease domain-containing protein [Actinomyces capricornis]|uniref:endonuclease domain-containing protein n=1 Tax=Actinomyces capricornis TaxID=2755559 RepID=UPI001CC380AD|nr:endonuclease domain-containing protein [Actinomyces capricornis]